MCHLESYTAGTKCPGIPQQQGGPFTPHQQPPPAHQQPLMDQGQGGGSTYPNRGRGGSRIQGTKRGGPSMDQGGAVAQTVKAFSRFSPSDLW